jgi:hypothetical protein
MPSFLKNLKSRAGALYHSDDEDDTIKYKRGEKSLEARTLQSTAVPAAMRGLYAAPTRRRMQSRPTQVEHLDRVSEEEDDDPNDPIVWNSMYPQMNGKRRSEVEADMAKYAGVRADMAHRGRTARNDLQARRQHRAGRGHRVRSVKSYTSDDDSDSGSETDSAYSSGDYSSDGNPEGWPVRVCIYPQAKYIQVPVETPLKRPAGIDQALSGCTANTTAKPPTPCIPSYRDWKRDLLPHTEFQILRRRQAMERAREELEPLYRRCRRYLYRNVKPKKGLIGHGETQWFAEPFHHVRLENSRMQYVLRKAVQSGMNQYSLEFGFAMTMRAENVCFCEMSDVDGAPVAETLLIDFLKALRKFQDKANVPKDPKLTMARPGELARRLSVEQRNDLRRVDSGVTMRVRVLQPVPVSHFDWDSSDDESETPKRLTKMKR